MSSIGLAGVGSNDLYTKLILYIKTLQSFQQIPGLSQVFEHQIFTFIFKLFLQTALLYHKDKMSYHFNLISRRNRDFWCNIIDVSTIWDIHQIQLLATSLQNDGRHYENTVESLQPNSDQSAAPEVLNFMGNHPGGINK